MRTFLKNIQKNYDTFTRAIFVVLLVIYTSFALWHLGSFISADEHFWFPNAGSDRISNYWEAIAKQKWEDTRINDKPGVTLALASGIALVVEKENIAKQIVERDNKYKIFNPESTKKINIAFRLPIVLITILAFIYFFWILKKITSNDWIALFSVAGMMLSPILIGMSQIVNPDSLFWVFGVASFLSFYAYVKLDQKRFAVFSSIFLGLALASKYVSVIFFPFFFVTILAYYFFEYENLSNNKKELSERLRGNLFSYLGILLGAMALFAVLMPASIVEPKYLYEGTIGFPGMKSVFNAVMVFVLALLGDAYAFKSKCMFWLIEKLLPARKYISRGMYVLLSFVIVFVLINWLTRNKILDLSDVPFDAKRKDSFGELPFYKKYIMEHVAFIFSMTPIALFLLLFSWIKSTFSELKEKTLIFLLSLFFIVFYVAVIMQGLLVTTRYSIILYPFALIIAGIGLYELSHLEKSKSLTKFFAVFLPAVLLIWIFSGISTYLEMTTHLRLRDYAYRFATTYYVSIPVLIVMAYFGTLLVSQKMTWAAVRHLDKTRILLVFAVLNIASVLLVAPFYFSYTNNLLPKKYIISGAWGYGGYEAAQYLNNLPDAKKITIWADAYGVCEFFVGRCIRESKIDINKYKIDYYFQSLQSTIPMKFPHKMEKAAVWRMRIDNRSKSFLKLNKALDPVGQSAEQQQASDADIEE